MFATSLAMFVSVPAARADGLSYTLTKVGGFGGEPSATSDSQGTLYVSSFGSSYRSDDKGVSWTSLAHRDGSGDDCIFTDQSGAVYWCNLGGADTAPLQADVWKSVDKGTTWRKSTSSVSGDSSTCGQSCSPFGVDRDWGAASILNPATQTTKDAEVVIMYHDFWGPSSIWVNISRDGGATFGPMQNVLASPATTPGAVSGSLVAEGYTFCNTTPSGVAIVPPGEPHAGRIYVGWIAADPPEDAAGCNLTQAEAYHTIWVSYSDDNGSTWTAQQAYDAGVGHDTSGIFAEMTLDNQGNPYFAFVAPPRGMNPGVCAAESAQGGDTLQADKSCGYDMNVVWSSDGGNTWDGGGGTVPGSAAAPYTVNGPSETGTHWFPAIAAAAPGQVDVAYLRTATIEPSDPAGKVLPGACAGPSSGRPNFPPACSWDMYVAKSVNLTLPPSGSNAATWTTSDLTAPSAMHVGDICNLGIACVGNLGSNRSLSDFIMEAIDPTTGCAHVAYADNGPTSPHKGQLVAANETAGCFAAPAVTPETPAPALLLVIGLPVAVAVALRRRRRDSGGFAA